MKHILIILFLYFSFNCIGQLAVRENIFGKEYYNEGLRIDKQSFEMIIKSEKYAWIDYKLVKPYQITARCFDGLALGSFAVAYFDKRKQFYYYGLGAAGIGFIFDYLADSKLNDAILITNNSLSFKFNILYRK